MKRVILGGLLQGGLVIAASMLFNVVLFGEYNEAIPVGRPEDSWHMRGLLPASTLVFGIGIAVLFKQLGRGLDGSPTRRGATFGLLVWACLITWLELFNYALYEFPFMAIVAGWACYLTALVGGGIALAHLIPREPTPAAAPG